MMAVSRISEKPTLPSSSSGKVNWIKTIVIVILPLIALLSTIWVPLQRNTAILAVGYSFLKGISITAGTYNTRGYFET
jgi:hypothetical protein